MDELTRKLALYARSTIPVICDMSPFMESVGSDNSSSEPDKNDKDAIDWDGIIKLFESIPKIDSDKIFADIVIPGDSNASSDAQSLDETKHKKSREELINDYMGTIQSAFKRITSWEDWKCKAGGKESDSIDTTRLFSEEKLGPTSDELKIREECVSQLREIDSKEEPNNIVYKFQMEILGRLATPVMKIFDLLQLAKANKLQAIYHDNWIGEGGKSALIPYGTMYHYGWEPSYNHEKMNGVIRCV